MMHGNSVRHGCDKETGCKWALAYVYFEDEPGPPPVVCDDLTYALIQGDLLWRGVPSEIAQLTRNSE